jgi:uncharacterized integral membrane protein
VKHCGLCAFEGEGDAFARHMTDAHGWGAMSVPSSVPARRADRLVAGALFGLAFLAFAVSGSCGFSYAAFGQDTVPALIVLFWIAIVGGVLVQTKQPIEHLLKILRQ